MAGHGFRRRAVSDGDVRLCPLVAPTTDLAQAGSEGWLQMASGSSARYEYMALRDCWTPPGTGLSVGQAIARGPWHAAVVARRLRRDRATLRQPAGALEIARSCARGVSR